MLNKLLNNKLVVTIFFYAATTLDFTVEVEFSLDWWYKAGVLK